MTGRLSNIKTNYQSHLSSYIRLWFNLIFCSVLQSGFPCVPWNLRKSNRFNPYSVGINFPIFDMVVQNKKSGISSLISSLTGKCAAQKLNFCSSGLWTCLHNMVISRSQNKITNFLCWAIHFNWYIFLCVCIAIYILTSHIIPHDIVYPLSGWWV